MLLIVAFLFSSSLWAQLPSSAPIESVVDILTHPSLQNNKLDPAIVEETIKLEDQVMTPMQNEGCLEEIPQDMSCQSLKESLLPGDRKIEGWRVLFEARYIPIGQAGVGREMGTAGRYFDYYAGLVRSKYANNLAQPLPRSPQELDSQARELAAIINADPVDVKGPLLLYTLQQTANYDEMMAKFRTLSGEMTDKEYLQFLSSLGGWADYNDARAAFKQEEGAGLGRVGPFEQIIGTQSGVCGDIHSMVAKFAEQRGWEAFTVGYALSGEQHVVTSVVDPKNPDKLMVVNYGRYEEIALNDGNSVRPVPTQSMTELGMQMRIFKNDAASGGDGGMQQIATIPTPLGSFMKSLFQKEGQIQSAMPDNENFRYELGGIEHESYNVITLPNGKLLERKAGQGIIVYEGQVDNAQVYGIAVSHQVFNKIYGYDPKQKKCVQRKSKYFAVGVASSLVALPQDQTQNNFYVYLNVKGGQIISLFETEQFKFMGLLGYELQAFSGTRSDGRFLSADGNLATYAGVLAEYKKDGLLISGGLRLETNVGLKDQNLMTDFSALPKNIAPFSFNALRTDLYLQKRLNDRMTFVTDNSLIMSRVGNRVILSTGIIKNNTSVMLSYQGGMRSFPIGNTLQSVNLLQNFNQPDGPRLTIGQKFSNPSGSFSGSVSLWAGMTTSTVKSQTFGGIQVKINLGPKKK